MYGIRQICTGSTTWSNLQKHAWDVDIGKKSASRESSIRTAVRWGTTTKFITPRVYQCFESKWQTNYLTKCRSSPPEVFLVKGVLKICSKYTREHPRRSAISIELLCNFIEIVLRQRCSPINLLLIFRTPFPKNTSEGLLLKVLCKIFQKQSHGGGLLKRFETSTGKHLCQSLFLNKVAGWGLQLYKKETPTYVFSCEFCEIFKNIFFYRTPPGDY